MIRRPPISPLSPSPTLSPSPFSGVDDLLRELRPPLNADQESAWRAAFQERVALVWGPPGTGKTYLLAWIDRKSTRLNSSHANISYAVFCLKKKTQQITSTPI